MCDVEVSGSRCGCVCLRCGEVYEDEDDDDWVCVCAFYKGYHCHGWFSLIYLIISSHGVASWIYILKYLHMEYN